MVDLPSLYLGCPRNKQKISFQTETNQFFRFVSVCFVVSDRYRNNRNKQKFVETNRNKTKKSPKTCSLRVSSKPLIFFSVRTKTNRNSICFGCFSVCFFAKPNIFFSLFRFISMSRTVIETTETKRTYGMGNKKGWYFNKFAAVSVCLLFVSVVSKHQNSLFRY